MQCVASVGAAAHGGPAAGMSSKERLHGKVPAMWMAYTPPATLVDPKHEQVLPLSQCVLGSWPRCALRRKVNEARVKI